MPIAGRSNSSNHLHKNECENGVGFDSQDQARDRVEM